MHPESFLSNFRGACHLEVTLFSCARLLAEAVSRTEDASGAAGAVLRASEKASRTREGCFAHRMSLPYRRSLFFTPNASENASRTREGCFAHRVSLPYRKSLFFTPNGSEDASRTTGGCFEHRVSIPYRRRAFLVPNAHSVCP